jgi:hypothetical protein
MNSAAAAVAAHLHFTLLKGVHLFIRLGLRGFISNSTIIQGNSSGYTYVQKKEEYQQDE